MSGVPDLGVDSPRDVGSALAARHRAGEAAWPSMHEYFERAQHDDWTLRSALVRYAQPEPVRAAAVLELVRRTDSGLAEHARMVERELRLSDLARAAHHFGDRFADVLDAYLHEGEPLSDEELTIIDVLAIAVEIDQLGGTMARWAVDPSRPRPDDEVDTTSRRVVRALDARGIERQDWYG